jgi:hypothetical protein
MRVCLARSRTALYRAGHVEAGLSGGLGSQVALKRCVGALRWSVALDRCVGPLRWTVALDAGLWMLARAGGLGDGTQGSVGGFLGMRNPILIRPLLDQLHRVAQVIQAFAWPAESTPEIAEQ